MEGVLFVKKSGPYPHKMKRNGIKLSFLFYILLIWGGGCVRTQRTPPPAYGHETNRLTTILSLPQLKTNLVTCLNGDFVPTGLFHPTMQRLQ